jgi:hypothetical protein
MKRFPLTASSLLRESFEVVVVGGIIDMYHLHKCCSAMAARKWTAFHPLLADSLNHQRLLS